MNNLSNQLDQAYDISRMELDSLQDEDIETARKLAEKRGKILENVFNSPPGTGSDQFLEKLHKLQKMQSRITESARNLHSVLAKELKKVKMENQRFSGYKKASSVTPIFNPYLNKKG
ncbi:MAG: hypothetical protein ACLFP9_07455 [Desulfonatronovibrio sp.]